MLSGVAFGHGDGVPLVTLTCAMLNQAQSLPELGIFVYIGGGLGWLLIS
jgi:hypothetical protein